MKPKEYAKELLAKMTTNADSLIYKNQYAKQCALIAVDEILKTNVDTSIYGTGFTEYWQQVKQELEKL
jgi:hypothetical protein